MSLYKGYKCAACDIVFDENDDVVVCPECGAPHHRRCYLQKGSCAFSERHAIGFKYSPEKTEDAPIEAETEDHSTEFKATEERKEQVFPTIPPEVILYGGVDPEDSISGVSVKDLAEYVGPSSGSFIRKWKMLVSGLGGSFNLPAFIFGPSYYLYRKMWLLGILYLIFSLVSATPSVIYLLLEQSGNLSDISFWGNISNVFSYISLAVKCLGAFFFNRLYLNKAKEDIQNGIKKGGVSLLTVPITLAATFGISVLITVFIEFLP